MAGFKTHITFSTILGAGYGTAAFFLYDTPWSTCVLAGGLCGVSGMLPDLDSGPGKPLHESMAFAAAVVPVMLIDRLQQMALSNEMIVLICAGLYLLIRFGGAALLKFFTEHRGMFHSLPAALIFGEVAFLLASGETNMRLYKAGAVVLGYCSHLFLDEVYSLEWSHGRLRLKNSFGTALKLVGHKWQANISTYAKLIILTFLVLQQPNWMRTHSRLFSDSPKAQKIDKTNAPASDAPSARKINLWPWR
ncbi:MAG: metal-dependent hydrolase [Thermoguttaceae bacterium]